MPDRPMTGRSLVTRRAIVDIVRGAVLGSYGVTGVDAGPLERMLGRLGLREPGIRVRLDRGLEIDLHLTVAYGVPVAEVARQVDSTVRYALRRALERDVRRLAVHVGGLRYQPASVPPTKEATAEAHRSEAPAQAPGPAHVDGGPDTEGGEAAEAEAPAPILATATRRRRRRDPRSNGRDPG